MWQKLLVIIILFYIFALLQNSFLAHFNLFGEVPNLVFILFFLLVFFSNRNKPVLDWENLAYAIGAGLFLDLFSSTYFGISIVILILIVLAAGIMRSFLKEGRERHSIMQFLPLFLFFLAVYEIISGIFGAGNIGFRFSATLIWYLVYNLIVGAAGFFIYKRFFQSKEDRQLSLFNRIS